MSGEKVETKKSRKAFSCYLKLWPFMWLKVQVCIYRELPQSLSTSLLIDTQAYENMQDPMNFVGTLEVGRFRV